MKYQLDDLINKVTCADCLEIMRDLPDGCVNMILTDPPYGIDYQSARRIDWQRFSKIDGDETINGNFISESYRILKDNSAFYCFTRWDVLGEWI